MIKKYFLICFLISVSCTKQSQFSDEFQCKSSSLEYLETVKDARNVFSIPIPKNWNINLYEDALQSSVFAADTTKQLTESILIDVSYIKNDIQFDDVFKLKIEQENLSKNLIQKKSKEITVLGKPTYFVVSKGKKSTFSYQKLQAFIKIHQKDFILAKVEIYGDSLVENRFCKAFSLIEKIKITPQ